MEFSLSIQRARIWVWTVILDGDQTNLHNSVIEGRGGDRCRWNTLVGVGAGEWSYIGTWLSKLKMHAYFISSTYRQLEISVIVINTLVVIGIFSVKHSCGNSCVTDTSNKAQRLVYPEGALRISTVHFLRKPVVTRKSSDLSAVLRVSRRARTLCRGQTVLDRTRHCCHFCTDSQCLHYGR
jgi:hypothetical protein